MTKDMNEKIRNVLTTEVRYIIFLVLFIFGVVAPYFQIKENISLAQKDIKDIKDMLAQHIEVKTIAQDETDNELMTRVTVLETKMGIKNLNLKSE